MTGKLGRLLLFWVAFTLFEHGSGQECTATGRFSIYGTGCKYYIQCTLSGGVYYSTTAYCPGVSYFNPRSQECVDSYICADTFCEQALDSSTTSATFAEFLDPNLSDGVSYIRCVRYNDTAVLPIYSTCPFTFVVSNTSTNEGCCPYVSCDSTTTISTIAASTTAAVATSASTATTSTITAATTGTTTTSVTAGTTSIAATTAVTAGTTSIAATTVDTSITVITASPTTTTTVITAVT